MRHHAFCLLTAFGASLCAQAAPQGAQPDEAWRSPRRIEYKRFTRGDDTQVVDEAWRRLEWFRERMGGDLGKDFNQRVMAEAARERARFPHLFPRVDGAEVPGVVISNAWTNLGPTKSDFTQNGITLTKVDSGRIRVILPHPTDANTVYLLTAGGGLWRTTTFLSNPPTWTPLTDALGSTAGGSAAFGRTASVLYLGFGDPFDEGVGGFLVKSVNGGDAWGTAVSLGSASKVYDVKVDTTQGADTSADIVLVGTNTGLFRSTNGGTSFTLTASGTGEAFNAKRVWSIVRTSAGWLAAAETSGTGATGTMYLSTDRGATWAPVTTPTGLGRISLAVGAPGDAIVYAFAADTGDAAQKDLYRSTDGGATWTALNLASKTPSNPSASQADMNLLADQAWFNQMILVDPADATRNTVYLGGQLASAKTANGGSTWTLTSDWLAQSSLPYLHADMHHAAAGVGGRILVGSDGGLFTSTDGGTTWDDTKNIGLASHLLYTLAVNTNVAGSALTGLQDNGTRVRVGTTSTFNQVRGGDGFGVGWSSPAGVSLSSYVYNAIRRSTTNPPADQSNFTGFTSGLGTTGNSDGGSSYNFVTPIVQPTAVADPTGNAFFTYGNGGTGTNSKKVFKSGASNWSTIATPGSGGWPSARFVRPVSHGLGIHPSDLNRIAAAGNGGYVLVTTNGGTAWTEYFLGAGATAGAVTNWQGFNANAAWATNDILYIASEATATGAPHVAKTTNLTATTPTWTRCDTGLPDLPVTKLVVDPGDATGSTVYAATWIGVYRTTDGGANWARFGTGLPQVRVTDIYIAPDSSFIRVATWGRGVWELVSGSVSTAPSISSHPAHQSVYTGQTATFTVAATGNPTPSYQWQKNGSDIGGATTNSYTTPPTVSGDNLSTFQVVVSNSAGTVTSSAATLTVTTAVAPSISTQPAAQSVTIGTTATFSVTATGTPTPTYQWKKNGTDIPTATSSSYTTPATVMGDSGATFSVVITNLAGSTTSSAATLTVNAIAPSISTQPTNQTVSVGATATFSVTATGNPAPTYQWQRSNDGGSSWADVASGTGGTTASYTTATLASGDNGARFRVLATNAGGTATSSAATLTVVAIAAPAISSQPAAQHVLVGGSATFSVTATGTGTLTYQWKRNGVAIPGATGTSVTLSGLASGDNNASITVDVTNGGGTTTSSAATLRVRTRDLNADATADLLDLATFSQVYGTANDAADLNGDGTVNDLDLAILLAGL